jgi:hypothetical protein
MTTDNAMAVIEFLIIGISNYHEQRGTFFTLLLVTCPGTLLGHGLTIFLVSFDPHLHTSM